MRVQIRLMDNLGSTDEEVDEMVEDMRDTAEARAKWVAAGSPWTADDQAFADRMSGY